MSLSRPAFDPPVRLRAERRVVALAAIVIIVLGIAAYATSFSGTLILDDLPTIARNDSIRDLTSPAKLFSAPPDVGTAGRPFANLSFALNYALSGLNLWSYHAANLALHLASALLLFGIVRRTLLLLLDRRATFVAFLAAALWVTHPLTTEAVTYLSQRTEILMATCYLGTLYSFIRAAADGQRIGYGIGWVLCLLGMASKESMVTAPLVVLLYDRTFLAGAWRKAIRERWAWYAGLAGSWLALAALMYRSHLAVRGVGLSGEVSPLTYALTECRAILTYAKLALWPHPLVFDYGWNYDASTVTATGCALLVLAIVGGVAWGLARGHRTVFTAAWFLIVLAPTSSFIPISEQPFAESRAYLPLAGLAVLFALGVARLLGKRAPGAVALALAALAAVALQRNRLYADEASVWRDVLQTYPDNARAHNALGLAYFQAGRLEDAIREHRRAVALRPSYAVSHGDLGADYYFAGDYAGAVQQFEAALRLDPKLRGIRSNLGQALLERGDVAGALAVFQELVRREPESDDAHVSLGKAYARAGNAEAAAAEYRDALRINPASADAHVDLGNVHFRAGKLPEAAAEYEAALQVAPDNVEAHNNLGYVLTQLGRPADAVAHFVAALHLQPGYVAAHQNYALTLLQLGRNVDAVAEFRAIVALQPQSADAHNDLGAALVRAGQPADAKREFTTALQLDPQLQVARENLRRLGAE